MAPRTTHVVDACALIAYFNREIGHDVFTALLEDEGNVLAMHTTNLCEVYYGYLRSDGLDRAEESWEMVIAILGVIDSTDAQFMKRVGRWRVDHNLALADAFAAATAEQCACALVTTDHRDFDPVEASGALQILWLR